MPPTSKLSAVFFDVDGVLLDSLPAHLQICADLSHEYGLGITTPTPLDFRELSRQGLPLSPMKAFFQTVGFGRQDAERATTYYEQHFHARYSVALFPNIEKLLRDLSADGYTLGIATANVRVNVENALGDSWHLLDPRLRYTFDHPAHPTKVGGLRDGVRELGISPKDAIFVGDQLTDRDAALQAGVRFLGVTYGWGISREDRGFEVAHRPEDLANVIRSMNHR